MQQNYLIQTESKHHTVFIPNILYMYSQFDSTLGKKTVRCLLSDCIK